MKKYTIHDATKEELIQYFFQPDGFGGGYRIPMMKDRFLMWLANKRQGELLDAEEHALDASQKALHEYIDYVKQANDEKDIDKKLELFDKANRAYKRYERYDKQADKLSEKFDQEVML